LGADYHVDPVFLLWSGTASDVGVGPLRTDSKQARVRTILDGLKEYGMFVADNGIEWAISVAPDPRIGALHEELRRVRGSAFEVVVAPE